MLEKLKGFENYYIDKEGNIYTKDKKLMTGKFVDNTGYYQIVLRKNGKRSYQRLHRLIAKQFIDNPNNLPQVNHKDGNKLNNSLDNLEWISNSDNTKHGYDNNLYHNKKQIKIIAINKISKEKFIFPSIRKCSEELKINRKTLSSILFNNKTNNYNYEFKIA